MGNETNCLGEEELSPWKRRPITLKKESCHYGTGDLSTWKRRPITLKKEAVAMGKETCQHGKGGLLSQKRRAVVWTRRLVTLKRETYCITSERRTVTSEKGSRHLGKGDVLPWNEDLLLVERSREPPWFHVTTESIPKNRRLIHDFSFYNKVHKPWLLYSTSRKDRLYRNCLFRFSTICFVLINNPSWAPETLKLASF